MIQRTHIGAVVYFGLILSVPVSYQAQGAGYEETIEKRMRLYTEEELKAEEEAAKKFIEELYRTEREDLEMMDREAAEASEIALVGANYITAPTGRWALLRKGTDLCAVRFTEYRHVPTSDPVKNPSVFTDSFFTKYETVFQGDGSGDLARANIISRHGELSKKPNIWRMIRGNKRIGCGTWLRTAILVEWWYPNKIMLVKSRYAIEFDARGSTVPNGIEVALTGWQNIADVNARDPRLAWHRFDPARDSEHILKKPKMIPVSELPGYR